jgi:3-oxoacid CoA-transferase subunit B
VVDLVITELGVYEVDKAAATLKLIEIAPGVGLDEIRAKTAAKLDATGFA